MTHFVTLVLVPAPPDYHEIEAVLAPYDENGEWFRDGSRWDYWVLGGRYVNWFGGPDWVLAKDVKRLPCAIVTQKSWNEEYRSAWFGCHFMVLPPRLRFLWPVETAVRHVFWLVRARWLLWRYRNHAAVIVDCHV